MKKNQSEIKEHKEIAAAKIAKVLGEIKLAANRIPKSIVNGKMQAAQEYKVFANKWFNLADKGGPKNMSLPKMELFYSEACSALERMRAD